MSNRVDLLRYDKPQKTCRDCYHWMACKTMLEAMGFVVDGDGKDADKRCNEFQAAADFTMTPHAHWIRTNRGKWRCSACRGRHSYPMRYCGECGARMDEKGREDG